MENNVDMFLLDVMRLTDTLLRDSKASPSTVATAAVQAAEDMQELADFLRSMRLTEHAACARLLVQLLQVNSGSGLVLAGELASLIKQAISAIESNNAAPDQNAELAELTASVHLIEPHLLTPHAQGHHGIGDQAVDMLHSVDQAMRVLSEMIVAPEVAETVANSHINALYEALQKEPRVPEPECRAQLLLLQAVQQTLAHAAVPADVRRMLGSKLHTLQGWTLGLGQQRLEHVLDMPGLAGLSADADVADALRRLLALLAPARMVRGTSFSLTLFIDVEGCDPRPESLAEAAAIARQFGGRIETRDDHLRILMPSSLQRLRVVPIARDGQRFCFSWAQFIEVTELPEEEQTAQLDLLGRIEQPLLQIKLQSGLQQHLVLASSIAPAEEAARFLCPQGLGLPAWLSGTIFDKNGTFLPWVSP